MDLNIFGTNRELEVDGVWHDLEDSRLLIARHNNTKYQQRIRQLLKPYQALIASNSPQADKILEKCTIRAMGETILIDWQGVYDGGEEINYSSDNAIEMLTKYPDFRDLVANLANQAQSYRTHTLEEAVKN